MFWDLGYRFQSSVKMSKEDLEQIAAVTPSDGWRAVYKMLLAAVLLMMIPFEIFFAFGLRMDDASRFASLRVVWLIGHMLFSALFLMMYFSLRPTTTFHAKAYFRRPLWNTDDEDPRMSCWQVFGTSWLYALGCLTLPVLPMHPLRYVLVSLAVAAVLIVLWIFFSHEQAHRAYTVHFILGAIIFALSLVYLMNATFHVGVKTVQSVTVEAKYFSIIGNFVVGDDGQWYRVRDGLFYRLSEGDSCCAEQYDGILGIGCCHAVRDATEAVPATGAQEDSDSLYDTEGLSQR